MTARTLPLLLAATAPLACVWVPACTSPVSFEKVSLRQGLRDAEARWPADALSATSREHLAWVGLLDDLGRDPVGVADALAAGRGGAAPLLAEAELSLVEAFDEPDKQARAAWLLRAAGAAEALVRTFPQGEGGPLRRRAFQIHRFATAGIVEGGWLLDAEGAIVETFEVDAPAGRWRVQVGIGEAKEQGEVPPIARFHASDLMRVEGLELRGRSSGVGAPVVAWRQPAPDREDRPSEAYYPPEGIGFDLTALLDVPPAAEGTAPGAAGFRGATLRLIDPYEVDRTDWAGTDLPLAADVTASYALLSARSEVAQDAWAFLLEPLAGQEDMGLYMLQPYDPDRIPVVLVHGLLSSPGAWHELRNAVLIDPVLRERYQFWSFYYPTGFPWAYSATVFREALRGARAELDPGGEAAAFDRAVIVAHSMGGLLARTAVTDSSDGQLWLGGLHETPLEELDLSEETRRVFERGFHFGPVPFVERVVFLATPHRGAPLATTWYAQLGRGVVSTPPELEATAVELQNRHPEGLKPWFSEHSVLVPDAVDELAPDMPILETLSGMPIVDGVTTHTIVGNRGGSGPDGGDGVVPRWSSRLEGASSELEVDAGHGVVTQPVAIREVVRILHEHLAAGGKPAAAAAPRVRVSLPGRAD